MDLNVRPPLGTVFAVYIAIVLAIGVGLGAIATRAFGGTLKHEFRLIPLPDRNPDRIVRTSTHEKGHTNEVPIDFDLFIYPGGLRQSK